MRSKTHSGEITNVIRSDKEGIEVEIGWEGGGCLGATQSLHTKISWIEIARAIASDGAITREVRGASDSKGDSISIGGIFTLVGLLKYREEGQAELKEPLRDA